MKQRCSTTEKLATREIVPGTNGKTIRILAVLRSIVKTYTLYPLDLFSVRPQK